MCVVPDFLSCAYASNTETRRHPGVNPVPIVSPCGAERSRGVTWHYPIILHQDTLRCNSFLFRRAMVDGAHRHERRSELTSISIKLLSLESRGQRVPRDTPMPNDPPLLPSDQEIDCTAERNRYSAVYYFLFFLGRKLCRYARCIYDLIVPTLPVYPRVGSYSSPQRSEK